MQNFLNTLGEFSREKEDKDNFIQKAQSVLQRHSIDKKRAEGCFCF